MGALLGRCPQWDLSAAHSRGFSEDLGQVGMASISAEDAFWGSAPPSWQSSASASSSEAVSVLLTLPGAPETCLGAAWCHGNACVLLVPAKGWRIPGFWCYFRAGSITRLGCRSLSPAPEAQGAECVPAWLSHQTSLESNCVCIFKKKKSG